MGDSQIDLGALSIAGGLGPDAVHVQLACHLQQLGIGLRWRLTPVRMAEHQPDLWQGTHVVPTHRAQTLVQSVFNRA